MDNIKQKYRSAKKYSGKRWEGGVLLNLICQFAAIRRWLKTNCSKFSLAISLISESGSVAARVKIAAYRNGIRFAFNNSLARVIND